MVRKTNRKGIRRQFRLQLTESGAKCSGDSSTFEAAPKWLPDDPTDDLATLLRTFRLSLNCADGGAQPAPDISDATALLEPEQPEEYHYLYMRAFGKRAAMINNEVRIITCQNMTDLSNEDVLEIYGKDTLSRAELPIERMIKNRNLKDGVVFNDMILNLQTLSKIIKSRPAGVSILETEVVGHGEGLYIGSCGLGKVVSNYYRLVCGLPTVDIKDPSPDIVEITGDLFEYLDMCRKQFALQAVKQRASLEPQTKE